MKQKRVVFLLGLLLLYAQGSARETRFHVFKALDGDSLLLSNRQQVRLLGIDCPEKGEPWAEQARSFTQLATEGKDVRLEFGPEREDHYHRLLAYVYCEDRFVNLELVQWGLAHVYFKQPHEKYRRELIEAQRQAMAQKIGEWSEPEPFLGSVISSAHSGVFHRPDCPWVQKVSRKSRIHWANRQDALYAGLSPCRSCKP